VVQSHDQGVAVDVRRVAVAAAGRAKPWIALYVTSRRDGNAPQRAASVLPLPRSTLPREGGQNASTTVGVTPPLFVDRPPSAAARASNDGKL